MTLYVVEIESDMNAETLANTLNQHGHVMVEEVHELQAEENADEDFDVVHYVICKEVASEEINHSGIRGPSPASPIHVRGPNS